MNYRLDIHFKTLARAKLSEIFELVMLKYLSSFVLLIIKKYSIGNTSNNHNLLEQLSLKEICGKGEIKKCAFIFLCLIISGSDCFLSMII